MVLLPLDGLGKILRAAARGASIGQLAKQPERCRGYSTVEATDVEPEKGVTVIAGCGVGIQLCDQLAWVRCSEGVAGIGAITHIGILRGPERSLPCARGGSATHPYIRRRKNVCDHGSGGHLIRAFVQGSCAGLTIHIRRDGGIAAGGAIDSRTARPKMKSAGGIAGK